MADNNSEATSTTAQSEDSLKSLVAMLFGSNWVHGGCSVLEPLVDAIKAGDLSLAAKKYTNSWFARSKTKPYPEVKISDNGSVKFYKGTQKGTYKEAPEGFVLLSVDTDTQKELKEFAADSQKYYATKIAPRVVSAMNMAFEEHNVTKKITRDAENGNDEMLKCCKAIINVCMQLSQGIIDNDHLVEQLQILKRKSFAFMVTKAVKSELTPLVMSEWLAAADLRFRDEKIEAKKIERKLKSSWFIPNPKKAERQYFSLFSNGISYFEPNDPKAGDNAPAYKLPRKVTLKSGIPANEIFGEKTLAGTKWAKEIFSQDPAGGGTGPSGYAKSICDNKQILAALEYFSEVTGLMQGTDDDINGNSKSKTGGRMTITQESFDLAKRDFIVKARDYINSTFRTQHSDCFVADDNQKIESGLLINMCMDLLQEVGSKWYHNVDCKIKATKNLKTTGAIDWRDINLSDPESDGYFFATGNAQNTKKAPQKEEPDLNEGDGTES